MDEDELFAQQLQQQFDEEAAAAAAQEQQDLLMAQQLTNNSEQELNSSPQQIQKKDIGSPSQHQNKNSAVSPSTKMKQLRKSMQDNHNGHHSKDSDCASSASTAEKSSKRTKRDLDCMEQDFSKKARTTGELKSPKILTSQSSLSLKGKLSCSNDITVKNVSVGAKKNPNSKSGDYILDKRKNDLTGHHKKCAVTKASISPTAIGAECNTDSKLSSTGKITSSSHDISGAAGSDEISSSDNVHMKSKTESSSSGTPHKELPRSASSCSSPSPLLKRSCSSDSLLPLCKYGSNCYRNNPVHFQEYRHTRRPASNRTPDKAGDKTTRTTSDKSTHRANDKTTQQASGESTHRASDKTTKQASGKSTHRTSDKTTQPSSDKSVHRASDKTTKQASGKSTPRTSDKTTQPSSDKSIHRASDKTSQPSSDKSIHRASDKTIQPSSDKSTYRASDKTTQLSGGSIRDKVTNKTSTVREDNEARSSQQERASDLSAPVSRSIDSSAAVKRSTGSGGNDSGPAVLKKKRSCEMDEQEAATPRGINHKQAGSVNRQPEPPLKRSKSSSGAGTAPSPRLQGFAARLAASEPYRMFQTKSFSVAATHKDPLGCVLPDLLHPSLGTLLETAQFSFVVDVDFVYETYKSQGAADKPLLLLYGELEGDTRQFTKGEFVKVSMPFLYGTHHSKLMLLRCVEGLRVVVHTANLRPDDWYEKTQGLWISPLFPKLDIKGTGSAVAGAPPPGDCPSLFRQDLLRYLHSYKLPQLAHWGTVIRSHDFAQCNAVFVGHAPGYHVGPELYNWGHLKLRRALGRNSNGGKWRPQGGAAAASRTIVQCSSIGSLGKDSSSWLCSELGRSLSGGMDCPSKQMVVMYPSEEDIRTSSQGWGGGSCLPYNSNTHAKQTWLLQHLHNWRSSRHGRTAAMPHIKSYTRVTGASSSSEAQYLLLTSANLSKAAWGQLQKQGGQLFIRSYEAGVLLLPHFVNGGDGFSLSPSAPHPLPLPYDLPPTPYPSGARPWFMDTKKRDKDINGDTYP